MIIALLHHFSTLLRRVTTILSKDSDGAVSGEGKSLSGTTNSDRSEQVHSETLVTRTGEVTRTISERP